MALNEKKQAMFLNFTIFLDLTWLICIISVNFLNFHHLVFSLALGLTYTHKPTNTHTHRFRNNMDRYRYIFIFIPLYQANIAISFAYQLKGFIVFRFFPQKLVRHNQSYTGDKPYVCYLCK